MGERGDVAWVNQTSRITESNYKNPSYSPLDSQVSLMDNNYNKRTTWLEMKQIGQYIKIKLYEVTKK